MNRLTIIPLIIFTCSACTAFESQEIKTCEEDLVRELKSPSSYKRIKSSSWDEAEDAGKIASSYFGPDLLLFEAQMLKEIERKPTGIRHVSITYDADNSYGAALRDSRFCNFIIVNGNLYSPSSAYDKKWSQHIDDVIGDKSPVTVKNVKYEAPLDVTDKGYDPFPTSGIELPPY